MLSKTGPVVSRDNHLIYSPLDTQWITRLLGRANGDKGEKGQRKGGGGQNVGNSGGKGIEHGIKMAGAEMGGRGRRKEESKMERTEAETGA